MVKTTFIEIIKIRGILQKLRIVTKTRHFFDKTFYRILKMVLDEDDECPDLVDPSQPCQQDSNADKKVKHRNIMFFIFY